MAKKKNKVEEPKVEELVEEPKVKEPKVENKKKIKEEFFAGKLVLDKYKNQDGEFVVLEGNEVIKL